jgi:hypothetical protein
VSLFDTTAYTIEEAPPEPVEQLSYGRRLTIRRAADIAAGRHPVTGLPLLHEEWGFTCGTCAHLIVTAAFSRRYIKCELRDSGSEATDIRKSWPACARYRIEVRP